MSYVGEMKDLIELYLAELERDGLDNVLGVGLPVVSGILTDFAQWLEDDVQDLETGEETIDISFESEVIFPDGTVIFTGCKLIEDEPNLTGFGDIVIDDAAGIENWDMPNQEELDKLGQFKAQKFIDQLRTDSDRADIRQMPRALTADEAYQEKAWAELDARPQPGFWKCIKEVISLDGTLTYFTKNKFYDGKPSNLNSGEDALVFIDDTGSKYRTTGSYIYEHFEFAAEFNPD